MTNTKIIIAALRDMAAKAIETKEVHKPIEAGGYNPRQFGNHIDTIEAYSKDWIAGRLLGIADTLEAMEE